MEDRPLAELFEPATEGRWREAVQAALKGGDFEKRLVSKTADGLRIEPLYPAAEPIAQPVRAPGPWRLSQRVDHPDLEKAAAQALADLEGGADSLTIVHAASPTARGFGLDIGSVGDLDAALDGVLLTIIALRLDAGAKGFETAAHLKALVEKRGDDPAELDIDLGLDPIGLVASTGHAPEGWEAELAKAVADFEGYRGRVALADGRAYHEAGASEVQELAAVLSTAVAYLRALETEGVPLDRARDALSILLVADADEFLTIAKFRAIRRLWARVEQACGLDPKPLRLHAESAWRMMSRRDPFVNILRTGMAAASAGLGGADSVAVLPYTLALGLPDAFARRVGRNSQTILIEESSLAKVSDPAAGAGGFEALTASLTEGAWAAFQEIEGDGGILTSLKAGKIQARIADVREARTKRVATRRDALTGASEFPFLAEKPVAVLDVAPRAHAAAGEGALPSLRLTEPFEALRDSSDVFLAAHGARPSVFLANLGPVAIHNARSTFAANAFAAGGIEALGNDGFSEAADLASAFKASGARIACLCSSDKLYETDAAPAAKALKEAGATSVFLAGKPVDADTLKAAGVDRFLFAGCDLLALLDEAQRRAMAEA
ncbi:methylmalonyl-CoA mutase family protein [Methylobacterium haplocladii]|uniref:Methylmalonyl-CoA mutase n=1 Tax=Methylobacterium haplocladii TaxID=1176176 RepID=A0A512IQX6_9HYPH|nr:methylmalonyl-CoA mutase family protein [Methylobacterium haplocladii]GEP00122.1 methylmalonyl-CoA mutase [Methylobacterium haplocladii]GJD85373.1 Methylmalonyl-CoA mutase small subunit [Methylobacterium haplocladii]GLS58170.1 methylmalonyl-CoA mutase [Methylobacterium haplocladii]